MIEIDQEGKALAISGRNPTKMNVEIINTYPARLVREDFLENIMKQLPEF